MGGRMRSSMRSTAGMARREFLQVGFSGVLGLGLPGLLTARSVSGTEERGASKPGRAPRARSMILVFLSGGLSHIHSFDMKPDAPDGIRGEFTPIDTNVAGLRICEHLPELARMADRWAVVRSLSHPNTNHLNATHQILTGQAQPGAFLDKIASRTDYPCYAGAFDAIRPRDDGLPGGVMLPTFLMEGPLVWPGQHAGFLGPRHDPRQITRDPNGADFKVDNLRLAEGLEVDQLRDRVALLDSVNKQRQSLLESAEGKRLTDQQNKAVSVLTSGAVAKAFDLSTESASTRDRYGRHMFGQSLLLSRRLIE